MASVGVSSIKLIDSDGDALDDGAGKLNVNATLVAGASIDIGDVEILGHAAIVDGVNNDVSSTTAEAIGVSEACKHIDVMASIANTGIIYVGASGVTSSTGIALYAGDVYSIDIENVNLIYVLSSVDGEDAQWVAYN